MTTLASLSLFAHQQKSLPALRLSLLNSQQSLTQPPQQGVKPAPGGTPPAIVAGPAVRIRHPNSVSTTAGASALPAGTLGHAAAVVCMEQSSWKQAWPQTQLAHVYTCSVDRNRIGVTNIYIQSARVCVENSITGSILLQSQY